MTIPGLSPAEYSCPYCGELNELEVDPSGGENQEFVEDCTVCCRPAVISAKIADGLLTSLEVERES